MILSCAAGQPQRAETPSQQLHQEGKQLILYNVVLNVFSTFCLFDLRRVLLEHKTPLSGGVLVV